jgi:hypothetical protein
MDTERSLAVLEAPLDWHAAMGEDACPGETVFDARAVELARTRGFYLPLAYFPGEGAGPQKTPSVAAPKKTPSAQC